LVSSRGPLTSPELDADTKRYIGGAARCFVGRVGTYRITMTVSACGGVTRVALQPPQPMVERCLQDLAHGWAYRVPDHARPTEFVYRLQVLAP
jgi:hypothetical protein